MSKPVASGIAIVVLLMGAVAADAGVRENSDTVVRSAEQRHRVRYENGETSRFTYVFTAHVTAYMEERGRASSFDPFDFHPLDTRRCEYWVRGYIKREGYLVSGNGIRAPLGDVFKVYGHKSGAYRDDSTLDRLFGKHSPCNDFVGHFNALKKSTAAEISEDFDTFLLTDVLSTSVKEASMVLQATFTLIVLDPE